VEGGDDGQAVLAVEPAHELEDLDLMLEIEEGGRFVQQKDFRFLSQGAGDDHSLLFAAAQLMDIAIGER
jgi:hypothetical protein